MKKIAIFLSLFLPFSTTPLAASRNTPSKVLQKPKKTRTKLFVTNKSNNNNDVFGTPREIEGFSPTKRIEFSEDSWITRQFGKKYRAKRLEFRKETDRDGGKGASAPHEKIDKLAKWSSVFLLFPLLYKHYQVSVIWDATKEMFGVFFSMNFVKILSLFLLPFGIGTTLYKYDFWDDVVGLSETKEKIAWVFSILVMYIVEFLALKYKFEETYLLLKAKLGRILHPILLLCSLVLPPMWSYMLYAHLTYKVGVPLFFSVLATFLYMGVSSFVALRYIDSRKEEKDEKNMSLLEKVKKDMVDGVEKVTGKEEEMDLSTYVLGYVATIFLLACSYLCYNHFQSKNPHPKKEGEEKIALEQSKTSILGNEETDSFLDDVVEEEDLGDKI